MTERTHIPNEEQAVAELARSTRNRRVAFAAVAFGATCAAVVGALLLFGGQLQTAEKARAGQARDELRRHLDAYRPKCQGLWRAVYAVDWQRVPEAQARPFSMRLSEGNLACAEVEALVRALPQRGTQAGSEGSKEKR